MLSSEFLNIVRDDFIRMAGDRCRNQPLPSRVSVGVGLSCELFESDLIRRVGVRRRDRIRHCERRRGLNSRAGRMSRWCVRSCVPRTAR